MIFPGHPRIDVDPAICFGKPRIDGTRMRVCDILEMLGAGASEAEILADFDYVTLDDIRACLMFAAQVLERPIAAPVLLAAE